MKHTPLLLGCSVLFLAACSQSTAGTGNQMDNPLYAKYYYQDLTDHMVDYTVQKDPIMSNPAKKNIVDATRSDAVAKVTDLSKKIDKGTSGQFQSDGDYAKGTALLLNNVLYIGPDFNVVPGPSLHMFISTSLDPRIGTGALATLEPNAVDLGPLKDPYAAQTYMPPSPKENDKYRSVAIWDTQLQRIFGFAQLQ